MSTYPMVSCIMPTKNRRKFIPNAIQYFLKQSYKNKELIIIDDGFDKIEDLVPNNKMIRYVYLDKSHTIGAKRNYANHIAKGDIIIHWDDDDFMADEWITKQVYSLINLKADITGIQNVYYYNPEDKSTYLYSFPKSFGPWVLGGSFCYYKHIWQEYPFANINIGEDSNFLKKTKHLKIIPHNYIKYYIATIHSKNTSFKSIKNNSYWEKIKQKELPSSFFTNFK